MAIARFLRQLVPASPFTAPPRPSRPVCMIGDVHGCADLLAALLDQLAALPDAASLRVILVGDLIDRGPDSAGVLRRMHHLTQAPAPFAEVICLMGNHERMFLDFLADPVAHGPRWLSTGGDTTLQSFGLTPERPLRVRTLVPAVSELSPAGANLVALRDALRAVLPPGMEAWLADLPLLWREGGLAVSHAGADPKLPLDSQSARALLWGHHDFRHRRREDGLWIVHGHFIVAQPAAQAGRISVDTGAFQTGRLTAVRLDTQGQRFLEAAPAV